MNLLDQLGRQAAKTPDFDAFHSVDGNLTVSEIDALCWRMVKLLQAAQVGQGDIVALLFSDQRMYLISTLAATRLGAVISCIPPEITGHVKEEMISATTASRVILDSDLYSGPVPVMRLTMGDLLSTREEADRSIPAPDPSSPFALFIGSGSTGKSKIMPNCHDQAERYCEVQRQRYSDGSGDTWSFVPPIHYRTPLMYAIAAITSGIRCDFVLRTLRYRDFVTRCRDLPVTYLWASAAQILSLLELVPKDAEEVLPSLKGLILGFSPISPRIRADICKRLTRNLIVAYGTVEAGTISLLMPDTENAHEASVGFPVGTNQIEIVDDDSKPVPANTPGHIRLWNDLLIEGYFHDPEKTARSFRDGFFYPGDNGKLLPDGQLVFLGRSDHMMIYRGVNIYPTEVERIIGSIEGIADVAVVPLQDHNQQDHPACAFTLKPGYRVRDLNIGPKSRQMLGMRAPQKFYRLESIPRTQQGKLDRERLYAEMHRLEAEYLKQQQKAKAS